MFEFLHFDFMVRGLLAAVISGATCSLVGVFVVLRGLSFIGAGIAHGAFAGVALGFLLGLNPLGMALVAAVAMVLLIEGVNRKGDLKMDASIGVVFSFSMALAIFFMGLLNRYTPDVLAYLFGNLLSVSALNIRMMAGVATLVALGITAVFKELQFSTFDPEMASVSGIPVKLVSTGLLLATALTIVISLQAVGELLVIALLVLPASAAYQLTWSLKSMTLLSVGFGVLASITGLISSYYLNTPSGASIVMVLCIIFGISAILSPKKRRTRGRMGHGADNLPDVA